MNSSSLWPDLKRRLAGPDISAMTDAADDVLGAMRRLPGGGPAEDPQWALERLRARLGERAGLAAALLVADAADGDGESLASHIGFAAQSGDEAVISDLVRADWAMLGTCTDAGGTGNYADGADRLADLVGLQVDPAAAANLGKVLRRVTVPSNDVVLRELAEGGADREMALLALALLADTLIDDAASVCSLSRRDLVEVVFGDS